MPRYEDIEANCRLAGISTAIKQLNAMRAQGLADFRLRLVCGSWQEIEPLSPAAETFVLNVQESVFVRAVEELAYDPSPLQTLLLYRAEAVAVGRALAQSMQVTEKFGCKASMRPDDTGSGDLILTLTA
jgi:hypothetical protein